MCLLEIRQSYYIIAQQKHTGFITIFIFVGLILLFSYMLKREYVSPNRRRSEMIGIGSMFFILVAVYIFYVYPKFKMPYQLEKNYSETVGTTIHILDMTDRPHQWLNTRSRFRGKNTLKKEILYTGDMKYLI
jgi:hypothetical protein